ACSVQDHGHRCPARSIHPRGRYALFPGTHCPEVPIPFRHEIHSGQRTVCRASTRSFACGKGQTAARYHEDTKCPEFTSLTLSARRNAPTAISPVEYFRASWKFAIVMRWSARFASIDGPG